MNQTIAEYQEIIEKGLRQHSFESIEPKELYEPCDYIINIGGKRLRPVLCLMANQVFGGKIEDAIKPALAIELFHNFSLMHDDIMDDASLRRGKQTVHLKYDLNTGILSGDALFVKSYQLFEDLKPEAFKTVIQLFSKTAIEVCEGQQFDKNFETKAEVSFDEYIRMIELKTAVLVGAALQIGAITANASENDQQKIYDFGKNLGIAFQLQDDYLDVFGKAEFGKTPAGDIIENKKTILYVKTFEMADETDLNNLKKWYAVKTANPLKINDVKWIFEKSGAVEAVRNLISDYTKKAMDSLQEIEIPENQKSDLIELANDLMKRKI